MKSLRESVEVAFYGPPPEVAPTLVFLHPGMGSASTWRGFPRRLAAATGCGALVYSRSGHGLSDPVDEPLGIDFMHREALESLPGLIEESRLRDFVLVGHSDGGSIALIYAGAVGHPGLRGVVTLAAHVFCEEKTVHSARRVAAEFTSGSLLERLAMHHGDRATWVFESWFNVWTDPLFMQWNLEEFLGSIEVPLLVIQGEDDEYGTRAQVDAIVAGAGQRAEPLWLADCGHAPHLDRPDEVARAIETFVVSCVPGAP